MQIKYSNFTTDRHHLTQMRAVGIVAPSDHLALLLLSLPAFQGKWRSAVREKLT